MAELAPIHGAQLLTYLRIGEWPVGLLMNFNVPVMKNGVRRLVLGLDEDSDLSHYFAESPALHREQTETEGRHSP